MWILTDVQSWEGVETPLAQAAVLIRYNEGMNDVTEILSAIAQGDPRASDELFPLVYQELRKLAASKLSQERPGQTLQATALVHEAFLRLIDDQGQSWDSIGHFFAAAAESMRRILIDRARHKQTLKRGGQRIRQELSDVAIQVGSPSIDLLALDEALQKLEQHDRVKAELVKLRFFAGLTIPQAAQALGIAHSTADKYWAYARCWLKLEMEGER